MKTGKRFLGIKTKPAVVKVKVKESNLPNEDEPKSIEDFISTIEIDNYQQSTPFKNSQERLKHEDLSGKAWVRDGKIFVKILKISIH